MIRVLSSQALLALALGALATCGGPREPRPMTASPVPQPNAAPPAPSASDADRALLRLRSLELVEDPRFSPATDFGTPALVSRVMTPAQGWSLWRQLRTHRDELGMVPVVVSGELELQLDDAAPTDDARRIPELLAKARATSAADLFARWADQKPQFVEWLARTRGVPVDALPEMTWSELHRECGRAGIDCPAEDPYAAELARLDEIDGSYLGSPDHGTPEFVSRNETYASLGIDTRLSVRVLLLAADTRDLPVFLGIGGWNECPMPDEHAAVFDLWAREYGAELVFFGGDVLELRVEEPPRTVEALRELTLQQFVYCPDDVYQGTGSVDELAGVLGRSTIWYFWWD